jgi:hypothetical protein
MFPKFYDVKLIADQAFGLFRGSLLSLSERLGVYRDDNCEHQAGSDSKITAKCFFELKKLANNLIPYCRGEIYGLISNNQKSSTYNNNYKQSKQLIS